MGWQTAAGVPGSVRQGGAGTGSGPAVQSGTAVSGTFPGSCGGFSGGMVRTGRCRNRKKACSDAVSGGWKKNIQFLIKNLKKGVDREGIS